MTVATATCSYVVRPAEDDADSGIAGLFQDASLYQTRAFGRVKNPGGRIEQFVLHRGDDVAAAALVRVVPIPLVGTSVAYIFWGPLFHRVKADPDATALADALEALRQEYVVRRRFALRIVPCLTQDDGVDWPALFRARGYRRVEPHASKRTMLVDLDRPLDELRRGLDQKWRNCLNRAEKGNLEVREGQDPAMFELFSDLYREMLARKRLSEAGDITSVRAAQAALPDGLQSRVFVALQDGQPSAATVCSAIGRRGVYLAGATGASGMSNKASYLLQWRIIQWLKERECRVYDLHGTNAEANPGVYAFKAGLCGKNGREVEMAGQFEAALGMRARLVTRTVDRANASFKRVKAVLVRLRGRDG